LIVKIRVWHNSFDELRFGCGSAIAKKRYTVISTSPLRVDRNFASDFRGFSTSHRAAARGIYGLSPVARSSRANGQEIAFRPHAGGPITGTIVSKGNRGTIFCQASAELAEWLFKPNGWETTGAWGFSRKRVATMIIELERADNTPLMLNFNHVILLEPTSDLHAPVRIYCTEGKTFEIKNSYDQVKEKCRRAGGQHI
jgi:hypothetical protein